MKRGNSLYNVKTKGGLFNLKINPQVRDEFKVAAELRGATMSGLIHQFIFRYIREVKTEMPDEFEARLAEILAEKHALLAQELSEIDTSLDELTSEISIQDSRKHAPPAPTKKGGKK